MQTKRETQAVSSERHKAVQEEKRLAKEAAKAEKARKKAEKDELNQHNVRTAAAESSTVPTAKVKGKKRALESNSEDEAAGQKKSAEPAAVVLRPETQTRSGRVSKSGRAPQA